MRLVFTLKVSTVAELVAMVTRMEIIREVFLEREKVILQDVQPK